MAYSENMGNETTVSDIMEIPQSTDHFQVYFAENHVSDAEKKKKARICRWGTAGATLELHC